MVELQERQFFSFQVSLPVAMIDLFGKPTFCGGLSWVPRLITVVGKLLIHLDSLSWMTWERGQVQHDINLSIRPSNFTSTSANAFGWPLRPCASSGLIIESLQLETNVEAINNILITLSRPQWRAGINYHENISQQNRFQVWSCTIGVNRHINQMRPSLGTINHNTRGSKPCTSAEHLIYDQTNFCWCWPSHFLNGWSWPVPKWINHRCPWWLPLATHHEAIRLVVLVPCKAEALGGSLEKAAETRYRIQGIDAWFEHGPQKWWCGYRWRMGNDGKMLVKWWQNDGRMMVKLW